MKKALNQLLKAILLSCAIGGTALAQAAFEKTSVFISGGPAFLQRDLTDVAFNAEYGLSDQIGVGIRSTSGNLISRSSSNGIGTSIFVNYHLFRLAKLDPFAGVALGKAIRPREILGTDNYSGLYPSLQAGARYLVTNQLGIYAQSLLPFRRGIYAGIEVGATFKINRLKQKR